MDDTDINNNLILIQPKFLPIPNHKSHYNHNNSNSKAVTKFHPAKVKGPSSSQRSVPLKSFETASSIWDTRASAG